MRCSTVVGLYLWSAVNAVYVCYVQTIHSFYCLIFLCFYVCSLEFWPIRTNMLNMQFGPLSVCFLPRVDSSAPLTHNVPRDLGQKCGGHCFLVNRCYVHYICTVSLTCDVLFLAVPFELRCSLLARSSFPLGQHHLHWWRRWVKHRRRLNLDSLITGYVLTTDYCYTVDDSTFSVEFASNLTE